MSGPAAPTVITVPFATLALSADINVVPVAPPATPNLACYENGFPHQDRLPVSAGGTAPAMQDFNGIFFDLSSNIAANQAGQYFPYNSTIATAISGYNAGAIVLRADGQGLWLNQTNGNSTNPDSGGAGWVPLAQYSQSSFALTNANVTLTAQQGTSSQIVLTGTLTSNVQLVFPRYRNTWLVINNTVPGAFAVTALNAGGTAILVPVGVQQIYSDGTNLHNATSSFGQFTCTYNGGTTAPTGLAYWRIANSQVTLTLPALTATSSSQAFNYSGIPQWLIPAQPGGLQQLCPLAFAEDNTALISGAYAGIILSGSTPTIYFATLAGTSLGWTPSGTKRVLGTIVYDLNPGL